jgi:hypothetical protein
VPDLRVRALLRAATPAELVEGLERNPGSQRLRDQGWTPAWFELDVDVDGEELGDRHFGLVWGAPGTDAQTLAGEQLELALEDALRNLSDFEGLEIDRDEISPEAIELRVDL